jgi:GNAT superfamily N-acetyltransferase
MTAWQSSLGALTIEQATPDELSLVMEIIDEAAAWLHAGGITEQWSSPMSQAAWDRLASRIADGNVFLARLPNGQAVGTLRFDWRDDELWRHDPEGGGYVHSFAIRNSARGHGVGAAMLEWAKQHVRERGRKYLRLDCWGANKRLCEHYSELGFTYRGTVYDDDGPNAMWEIES